jgi:pimeloyl-ACP methyl ester carboxylesterase
MATLALSEARTVAVWSGGDPDGWPIYFLHGCPDCRLQATSSDAPASASGTRVIAINRPGYGTHDSSGSTHSSVADDICAVADLLGHDRFSVLGMSVGGPYALACAALHPDRVTSVGLVGAPADPADTGPGGVADGMDVARPDTVEEAMELFRPGFIRWVDGLGLGDDDSRVYERFLTAVGPLDAATLQKLPRPIVVAELREALTSPAGYLRDAALTFRSWRFSVADVTQPAYLWYGSEDGNASNAHRLAARIPRSKVIIHPKTGHLAALVEHWRGILTTLRGSVTRP